MATKNQITGGGFQDALGNPLALGYLQFELSQDSQVNGTTQIAAGYIVKINLDSSGNISTSPAQSVWPNDVISPVGTFYLVSAFSANGQLVWGPNAQQVLSTPSPFDIGVWVPASVNTGLGGSSSTFPSTIGNLPSFVNTTGGLQDSGVEAADVVLRSSNNQFGNTIQTFGLSGSGEVQVSNIGITIIDPSLTNVAAIDTATGTGLFSKLATSQTPAASTTASDHSVPIVLNGTTYYMRLSTTP